VNLSRNIIEGVAGGLGGGALLGLVEASFLLYTQGAPDLLSPLYAVILYALIGIPLGLGGGIALTVLEKFGLFPRSDDALAFQFGVSGAVAPMLLFILMYLGNKVVYAEQGIPLTGKLVILGIVVVFAAAALTVGRALVQGPLKFAATGPGLLGSWVALIAATGAVSFVPVGDDPRATFASGKPVPAELNDKPNVLLIAIDTLRADALGTYGAEDDPSPVLDGIADDGIVFENFFANASWTRSSFASLWSSRIPSSHNADTKAARMADELELLSEVLQAKGVTTGNLANNINVTSTFNFDQGWDSFVYEAPAYSFGATESVFSLTFYKVVHKLNEKLGGAKHVESFYQPVEVLTADAQRFIEANKDSRWMLGVHLMEPHDPFFEHPYIDGSGSEEFNGIGFARAEVEHPDMKDAAYLAETYKHEVMHMDKKLASFVKWLKDSGNYDNTLIVITSDHGEEFGEHGGFWHGTTLYEEQIHVAMIVKLPGNQLAGTRVDWQSRLIDVAPTIAASLGIAPSTQWEGSDLLAEVRDELADIARMADDKTKAEALVARLKAEIESGTIGPDAETELAEAQASLERMATAADDPCAPYRRERDRVVVSEQDFEGNVISSIRKGGFKFIRANDDNPRGLDTQALFDIVADSGETKNLTGSDAQKCGQYFSDLPRTLDKDLGAVLVEAASQAADGGEAEMSAAEKQRLCALGYLSGPDCE
jgi:arylsulfatase A-like enzyme